MIGQKGEWLWELRSGSVESAYRAQYLSASGAYYSAFPARTLAVRPALHCPVWLRSGFTNHAYNARYLTASGMRDVAYPARLLAVRPALHLTCLAAFRQ